MGDQKDNVKVAIRIRPLNEKERQDGGKNGVSAQDPYKTLQIDVKSEKKCFTFDYIANEDVTQEEVFETIAKPITKSCLTGYNGTIFAYGQTGAGKTFTILGSSLENASEIHLSPDYPKRGLLPRCFEYIFNTIQEESLTKDTKYLIKCSYLEIYQEQIIDLLEPNPQSLQLREDIRHGVYVDGLSEETVNNVSETYNILKIGTQNRHVGCTSMNKESSRSHSVFTLMIESKECREGLTNFRTSRFSLIDLAGSERQKATDCAGERLKEAGMINKSLSALGNVINSLVDISEGKSRHVHYRDSKLTFLLKDSLGGNSKTYIVANISPSLTAISETLSTLKFAQRAKQIKNAAVVNEDTSGAVSMLRYEVKRLKDELSIARQDSLCSKCLGNTSEDTGNYSEILQKTLKLKKEDDLVFSKQLGDKDLQIQGLKNVISKLENKINHDKMILKFRDASISSLQNNNFNESQEIKDLKSEIESLKEQIDSNPTAAKLFVENERINKELAELKNDSKTDHSRCVEHRKELEEINYQLVDHLNSLKQSKDELLETTADLECRKKKYKKKISELKETVERLKEKISDLEILNLSLQADGNLIDESNLRDSKNSYEDMLFTDRDEMQSGQIDEALQCLNDQQVHLQTELLNKIKYEETINELQAKINELESRVKSLLSDAEVSKASQDFETQIIKMAEDINMLEAQYLKKEIESQESQKLINDLNEEIKRLSADLKEKKKCKKNNKDTLQKELEDFKTKSAKYKEKMGMLKKKCLEYERIEEVHQEICKNYEDICQKYVACQDNCNEIKGKLKETSEKCEEHSVKNQELVQKYKDEKNKNKALTADIYQSNDRYKDSIEKIQDLTSQLSNISRKHEELRQQSYLSEKEHIIKDLSIQEKCKALLLSQQDSEQKLISLQQKCDALEENLTKIKDEDLRTKENLKVIMMELEECKKSKTSMDEKMEYYRTEYLKAMQNLEASKNEAEELATRLKLEKDKSQIVEESLECAKLEFAKLKLVQESKYKDAVEEIKHLESELNKEKKAQSNKRDLENKLRQYEEDLKVVKNSADSFQELNLILTQKNAELSNNLSKIHSSHIPSYIVDQLRSQLTESQEEILSLKEENRQKSEILKSTKLQITSTKAEFSSWKKCIDDKNAVIQDLKSENTRLKEKQTSEESNDLKYLKSALLNKEKELKELKEKGQEYYSQADEVLENMRKKCFHLQTEVNNLKDELKSAQSNNISIEPKRNKSALRENTEYSNRTFKSADEFTAIKSMNQKLTEELRKNVEIIEILQRRSLDMNKKMAEICSAKSQYEEEIENLSEGLTRITDFVFSIPTIKFNPEENSIVESTIKAISLLYDAARGKKCN